MGDDLGDAVAVAKIDKRELAMIAAGVYPAGERHILSRERGASLATGMRPQHLLLSPGHP